MQSSSALNVCFVGRVPSTIRCCNLWPRWKVATLLMIRVPLGTKSHNFKICEIPKFEFWNNHCLHKDQLKTFQKILVVIFLISFKFIKLLLEWFSQIFFSNSIEGSGKPLHNIQGEQWSSLFPLWSSSACDSYYRSSWRR